MSYIRLKTISSQKYAYLVEIVSTPKGPRQKVKQYLGKVHSLELIQESDTIILGTKKKDLLQNLVLAQLKSLGFQEKDKGWFLEDLSFDPEDFTLIKKTKTNKKQAAVLSLNQGHLCTFTLQRIINFQKSKNFHQDAQNLAKSFLEAGLPISKELFVKYYQSL
ncbi:MAG TPA: hypothetical protein VJA23_05255 [Candidatus Nanoarchaeia archaeon]|nr:hypothetical protein [Candidatus Nanoarchaeia archaeon]